MFRIKVCGITSVADALLSQEAGADAIGLNFCEHSPRYVEPGAAAAIADALGPGVLKVGVFVNATAGRILHACEELRLELVQLHGDEPPELLAELAPRPLMRAFRVGPRGLQPVAQYLKRCGELNCLPRLVLLDASSPGLYGGTGRTTDWQAAAEYSRDASQPPLVLAGGLRPENVAAAIAATRPAAVDAASGVEAAPGRKDPGLVRAFVAAAREAFARHDAGHQAR